MDFAYNSLGQFTDLDRYASLDTSEFVANTAFTYDLANRLTNIGHTQDTTTLRTYAYTYDAAGRFVTINSSADGTTTYTHDDVGQLTDADHSSITDEAYEYDDNGNRVMSGYVVGANNRISTNGVFDFEYDDEGNMVAKEEISSGERIEYEWDHRNRLVRIVFKDEYDAIVQVVEQTYDYQNRWVRSQIDADGDEDFDSERFFAYDGNQIVLDFAGDAATDLSHRYLWGPAVDQILADEGVDSLTSAGDILWPLTDHLGTTRDLAEYDSGTDTTTIASHRIFDSFGNRVSESAPAVTTLFGFTARPFDTATGLQWNLNRWYVSTLGVWMSEDPIGFAAGDANARRYIGNKVKHATDPNGLKEFEYPDPDGTQGIASVATIDIKLVPNPTNPNQGLCGGGSIDIEITVDVHAGAATPWSGVNRAADTLAEIWIDGEKIKIENAPADAAPTSTFTITHTIESSLPRGPSGRRSGSGEIKIVDPTRKGDRTSNDWTGVSQIYDYSWSYQCGGWGLMCCLVPFYSNLIESTAFSYIIDQTYNNTVSPNGEL